MNEHENIAELLTFLQTNSERTFDTRSGSYAFEALVTYDHHEQSIVFETTAIVETDAWDGGKLSLIETNKCPSRDYHLDFRARFNAMLFNVESNLLIVSGKSAKMGDYKVMIQAVRPRSFST